MTSVPIPVWNCRNIVAPSQVHVWILRTDRPRYIADSVGHVLSADEKDRAGRFLREPDMISFTLTRACLRMLLAHMRQCDPAAIQFTVGTAGKPWVEGGPRFNVSHSGAYALVAMAQDRHVGVDVEWVRPPHARDGVSAYFSAAEQQVLLERSAADQAASFYSCWTRKEAYLKARGAGLGFGLDRFTVSIAPAEPALLWVANEPDEPRRWRLRDLSVDPDYAGTVAAEGQEWELVTWRFDFPTGAG